ncbi:MAG TPA: hypothetical protein VMT16_01715 [Thermoanaerobaculia bacterium]|nr:hypothetical protein [Thermoanaerobaculia bacterium]
MAPAELTLRLTPRARYDVIDVTRRVVEEHGELLGRHARALYCSYHTTAGYLEQSLCARLQYSRQRVDPFIRLFQRLFPPEGPYRHDQLDLRSELSPAERASEPKNADSHLAFIGSGLRNCVTYVHRGAPVPAWFIDLDGVVPAGSRQRQTTVVGYDRETVVAEREVALPVSRHPVDSVNLRDPRLGAFAELCGWAAGFGLEHGRLDLALAPGETHVGLTVNEYETLLMQHDLVEVLRDPLRFAAEKGRNMLRHPLAIPGKTLNYAKYDLVHVFNEAMDALKMSESAVEKLLSRVLAVPAARFLRLKRSVSLRVSGRDPRGPVVCGTYQSPILVQWRPAAAGQRTLRATLVELS